MKAQASDWFLNYVEMPARRVACRVRGHRTTDTEYVSDVSGQPQLHCIRCGQPALVITEEGVVCK